MVASHIIFLFPLGKYSRFAYDAKGYLRLELAIFFCCKELRVGFGIKLLLESSHIEYCYQNPILCSM